MVDTLDIATLVVSLIVSLLTTLITVPWLIKQLANRDIMGIDQNKPDKPKVPEMGGLSMARQPYAMESVAWRLTG